MISITPKYRWIENLHNIHKGEEIWVLGTGPSLDDFPDDFFDEKYRIVVAAGFSSVAFPSCTYTAFPQGVIKIYQSRLKILEKELPDLRTCIMYLLPTEWKNKIFLSPEPIYLRGGHSDLLEHHSSYELKEEYFLSLAKNLLNGTSMPYVCSGTNIHSIIQAAVVMGAKKITLAGCEAKYLKFQMHAHKRGLDKIYKEEPSQIPKAGYPNDCITGIERGLKRIKIGTAFLAKIMEPYGIQIARYYYGKGYELIDPSPFEKYFFQKNIHVYGG